jgi:hypothetical protein
VYEHDFGETDAGNSDYYNDMYFENEEDDFRYAEDYDRGMPTQIFVFSLYCKILTYSLIFNGQFTLATISPFDSFNLHYDHFYAIFISFWLLILPLFYFLEMKQC